MTIRLVRYLAQCGVVSRRGAADLVREGAVQVNGVATRNVALGINPEDEVQVHGKIVRPAPAAAVLMLHKPAGVVCSRNDPHNPRTAYDLVPRKYRDRLKTVGRLDKETFGLLLLTDDGDLAYRLTHPRYGVEKTYRVKVEGRISDSALDLLSGGIMLDDGPTAPARVLLVRRDAERSEIEIAMHEGRNRQVRRMCEALGHSVLRLERTRYGPLSLGNLKPGETRLLSAEEVLLLRESVGLAALGSSSE
jgi:23S rRNA pseudouridine2605 synthase